MINEQHGHVRLIKSAEAQKAEANQVVQLPAAACPALLSALE